MPCRLHVVQVRGPAVHGRTGVVPQEEGEQLQGRDVRSDSSISGNEGTQTTHRSCWGHTITVEQEVNLEKRTFIS